MTMLVLAASGILFHHFWGTYCADIVLTFASPADAKLALKSGKLGDGWKIATTDPSLLYFSGAERGLDRMIAHLVTLGADRTKIASLAHSVDCGDEFSITVECLYPDPKQLTLDHYVARMHRKAARAQKRSAAKRAKRQSREMTNLVLVASMGS